MLLPRSNLLMSVYHVCIGITVTLGLAETHAVDDGCVVQSVRDDGIVCSQQRLEYTAVGIEAGSIEDGVLGLEVVRDGSFKLLVHILCTADKADAGHTVATGIHHVLGSLDQTRVVGETEVVVGTEVQQLLALHLDGSLLGTLYEAFLFVESGLSDGLQFLLEMFLKFTVH